MRACEQRLKQKQCSSIWSELTIGSPKSVFVFWKARARVLVLSLVFVLVSIMEVYSSSSRCHQPPRLQWLSDRE